MGSLLLFGRSRSPFTKRMVRAATSHFDDLDPVLYVFGRRTRDFTDFLSDYDAETLWDYDLDHDRPSTADPEYLRSFERRHGAGTIRRAVWADRKLIKNGLATVFNEDCAPVSEPEIRRHAEARARAVEELFETHDFEFVFGQQVNYLGGMLAYTLAESTGTPFFRVGHSRIADRYVLNTNAFEYSAGLWREVEKARANLESWPTVDEADATIERIRDGGKLYSVPIPEGFTQLELSGPDKWRYVWDLIRAERAGFTTDYYAETPNLRIVFERVRKRARAFRYNHSRMFDEFDADERYVYFPLQVQPELSLMVFTPYFTELDTVARYTAQAVPGDTLVYVNEHPNNWGVRSASYYRRLQCTPNLRMLHRRIPTPPVMANAEAIVCVTATVGLEALMHGIPVVTFGREKAAPLYANFDCVRTVSPSVELPGAIADAMDDTVDMDEVRAYAAAALSHGIRRDREDFPEAVCSYVAREIGY